MTLAPDPQAITHFLSSVVRTDIHLVALAEPEQSHGSWWGSDAQGAAKWAEAYSLAGWNIYWTANIVQPGTGKKPSKTDIASARWVHVDIDPPKTDMSGWDKAAAHARLAAMRPTVIIDTSDSGGGWQGVWRLTEPCDDPDLIEAINRGVIVTVDGDRACWNIDRLLRLPETINYPNARKRSAGRVDGMARLVQPDNGARYAVGDMCISFPPLEPFAGTITRNEVDIGPWVPLRCADLSPKPTKLLRQLITKPRGENRSGDVMACAAEMTRSGYPVEVMVGILMNPDNAVHAHMVGKRNPLRCATRAIQATANQRPSLVFADAPILPDGASLVPLPSAMQMRAIAEDSDVDDGVPPKDDKNSHLSAMWWARKKGARLRYNEFSDKILLPDGRAMSDDLERDFWFSARETGLNFSLELFGHALRQIAWEARYHPVREYLNATQPTWDGTARIDTWLIDYAGAEDNEYVRAVGRLFLLAAVRRARDPGAKFDELLVLEGPQGRGKSTLFEALCPDPSWFTDNISLSMSTKEVMEVTAGKWIVEAPELSRLRNAEVEHVKAMLSRRFDKARGAYARYTDERGRGFVWAGTTNSDQYLHDRTGNRRFWPVLCGIIRLAWIPKVRDQLWAEAAHREAVGESIRMDESLWELAAIEQEKRMAEDPIEAVLAGLLGDMTGKVETAVLWTAMGIGPERRNALSNSFGQSMISLGWKKTRGRTKTGRAYFYVKGSEAREIILKFDKLDYAPTSLGII